MIKLVLLRHGESVWNREGRFTGWRDVGLTERGVAEAERAGELLRESGFSFDLCFTSYLKRAIKTLWIVLEEMDCMWVPVHTDWRLNERHYGALQGLSKAETMQRVGKEQVLIWRRSYGVRPPPLDPEDAGAPGKDPRYAGFDPSLLPLTENLEDTVRRVVPCWTSSIAPVLRQKRRVLIAAHNNSLRALRKHLEGISDADIMDVEIPNGVPLVYELGSDLKPRSTYCLGESRAAGA